MSGHAILEGVKWFTTEYRHTTLGLILLGALAWPTISVVLYLETRGLWVTPIMLEMKTRHLEHQEQAEVQTALAHAQVEIAAAQKAILENVHFHFQQSLKKDRMLAFFVYKACHDDQAQYDVKICDRMNLFENEPLPGRGH
jgi:hypothetical protein